VVDLFRLEQVFRNILDNALAACPDPVRISLTASVTQLHGREALVIFIGDNGPGIARELREKVFEPFYTTKARGTGLGMAIARRIVEAHGGQITVCDTPFSSPAAVNVGQAFEPDRQARKPNLQEGQGSVGEMRGAEIAITLPRGDL
jgi:signal transduction histidine kinase